MPQNTKRSEENTPPPPMVFGRHGPGMHGGKKERAKDRRGTLLRLWGYLRRQRTALLVTSAMVIVSAGLNLVGPYLLGLAIDDYIIPGDLPGLARIGALMLGVHAAISGLTYLQSYVMAAASQRTVRDIRNDLFEQMQELSLRFFDQHAHGDLMSRLTNDVENINMVLSESVTQLVSGLITLVGVAAVMLWVNPMLAVVSLLITPSMMVFLTRWIASHTREGFRKQQSSLGTLNGLIEETIGGQRVVKTYVREDKVIADFDAANTTLRQDATHAQIYAGYMGPIMNFVGNLSLAIIAGVGGWMALRGMATVGTIASFINYTRQFSRPLNEIANLYNTIQAAIAGAERLRGHRPDAGTRGRRRRRPPDHRAR
ncbi:MAG: ABC transporter ATP-binding protein [Caldilineaceae bacterium]